MHNVHASSRNRGVDHHGFASFGYAACGTGDYRTSQTAFMNVEIVVIEADGMGDADRQDKTLVVARRACKGDGKYVAIGSVDAGSSSVVAPAIPLPAQVADEPLAGLRVPEEGVDAEVGKTSAQNTATRNITLSSGSSG